METKEPEFHTQAEQETLLKAATNPKHKVIILLMLDAGMRVTEARSTKWENCDFRKKTVKVESLKKRRADVRKESDHKTRIIPMSDRLYLAFDEYLKTGVSPKGFIFPGEDKGRMSRSAVNMMLNRLSSKTPTISKAKPHKLRHTFATNLRANGTDLQDIKDLLGHEDSKTTEIYTHYDVENLRMQIEAAAPRKSVWQIWKARLFPRKRTLINLLVTDTDFIVGREKEQKQIQSLISRDISVIIIGEIGSGKTHLFNSLTFAKKTLVIDDTSDLKSSIVAALLMIFGDKETAAAMLMQTNDLKAAEKKLSIQSLPNLIQTLKDATAPHEYLLKIGNVDGITPKGVKVLEQLKDHFTIITTARAVKMESASFMWNFEKIELKPLSRADSLKMIYRLISDCEVADFDSVMTRIYETADGNPRKLLDICERVKREPFVNLDTVNEVANNYLGRQSQEIDASIFLLVILGGFVFLRYYGRESGEQDLQFIGGCIMIVLMFARFFFRGARRKNV